MLDRLHENHFLSTAIEYINNQETIKFCDYSDRSLNIVFTLRQTTGEQST